MKECKGFRAWCVGLGSSGAGGAGGGGLELESGKVSEIFRSRVLRVGGYFGSVTEVIGWATGAGAGDRTGNGRKWGLEAGIKG